MCATVERVLLDVSTLICVARPCCSHRDRIVPGAIARRRRSCIWPRHVQRLVSPPFVSSSTEAIVRSHRGLILCKDSDEWTADTFPALPLSSQVVAAVVDRLRLHVRTRSRPSNALPLQPLLFLLLPRTLQTLRAKLSTTMPCPPRRRRVDQKPDGAMSSLSARPRRPSSPPRRRWSTCRRRDDKRTIETNV